MVGKRTREVEVVGSNLGNAGKNRTRAYSHKKQLMWEIENINLIFIHAANIYFSTQKNDACYLCVDIDDGLKIPQVTAHIDACHLLRTQVTGKACHFSVLISDDVYITGTMPVTLVR